MRVLDLWSYCSMGRLEDLDSTDFLGPFFGRATKIPRRRKRALGAGDNLSRLITCQGRTLEMVRGGLLWGEGFVGVAVTEASFR